MTFRNFLPVLCIIFLSGYFIFQAFAYDSNTEILSIRAEGRALLHYPDITFVKGDSVFFADGSTLPYDDHRQKSFDEKLADADIEDIFTFAYPAFAPIAVPGFNEDPGRFRNDALLKKIYGSDKKTVEKNLITVRWLPRHGGRKLLFNGKAHAAEQLQQISDELDRLPDDFMKYVKNINGTYSFRKIAGTDRPSAHSYGIAIDLDTKHSSYWLWDRTWHYRNEIPQQVVDIFERHGFIWGGRWYHYDTMHFEYRPEMFGAV